MNQKLKGLHQGSGLKMDDVLRSSPRTLSHSGPFLRLELMDWNFWEVLLEVPTTESKVFLILEQTVGPLAGGLIFDKTRRGECGFSCTVPPGSSEPVALRDTSHFSSNLRLPGGSADAKPFFAGIGHCDH